MSRHPDESRDPGQMPYSFVLFIKKVPKLFRGAKTRYRPSSSDIFFHPAQTVAPLKTFFPFSGTFSLESVPEGL